MSYTKLFLVTLLSILLVLSFSCSKKYKEGKEPVMEEPVDIEVTEEIPAVEEEPVVEEPVVVEEKMPELKDVFFDFDKYNLKDEFKNTLEKNARELKNFPSVNVVIEGHCDERGTEDYNLALGEKRAKAARDYLVSLGIKSSRITVVSYGETRPFAFGHDESSWAQNRRAHFVMK